jgi:phosphoribosylformylglycinamidine synthase
MTASSSTLAAVAPHAAAHLPRRKWAVVVFPGSNCDRDAIKALRDVLYQEVTAVWHTDTIPADTDCIVVPGGFSYGDYLRAGALASRSPVMQSVVRKAGDGVPVIGVCNGFQVLVEAGLLPGVLMKNKSLRFRCMNVHLRTERANTPFTKGTLDKGQVIELPIAHGYGNYFAPAPLLAELEAHNQVLFRYCAPDGSTPDEANPNGSCDHIAGITNRDGNVLGMMPHPERACDALLGGTDGQTIFRAMINWHD